MRYRKSGAVHGCALCKENKILDFVEDVGRHNAVDAIAGHMWLNNIEGTVKFLPTGRLTQHGYKSNNNIPMLIKICITEMG